MYKVELDVQGFPPQTVAKNPSHRLQCRHFADIGSAFSVYPNDQFTGRGHGHGQSGVCHDPAVSVSQGAVVTQESAVDDQSEQQQQLAVGDTVMREEAERRGYRGRVLRASTEQQDDSEVIQATPRLSGAYPRAIEHQERVEYQYDPETDDLDAKVIESSEPVVTQWDMSAPERDARPVGTWEVTPREDGVDVENVERADVPEDVQERLRQESAETGGPVSTTATVRFQHDLDTRETSTRSPGRSPAALAEALQARRQAPAGAKLNDRYQQILEGMMKQREQVKSARAGAAPADTTR